MLWRSGHHGAELALTADPYRPDLLMKPLETQQRALFDPNTEKMKSKWHFLPLKCTYLHCISKLELRKLAR